MIPFRDLIAMLHFARTMSTFGPDFEDQLTQKAWHSKLKNVEPEILKKALSSLSGGRNFPTPNDILEFCKGASGVSEMSSDEAFELLWSKIGSVGGYNDPKLPNEIGLAVQRLGGWKFICANWSDDKRPWHEKAFKEIYSNLQESKAQRALPVSKYSVDKPKQIGVVETAIKMAFGDEKPSHRDFAKALKDLKESTK